MRFTEAWNHVLSQNVVLRFVILILGICTIALSVSTAQLSLRAPLIVERGCFSKVVSSGSTEVSADEIEAFASEAIRQRFDSQAKVFGEYLSREEMNFRLQEQRELSTRSITQKVSVNSVKIQGNIVQVDADRLISVGTIRSALPFPLELKLSSQSRSQDNPYGLIALKVIEIRKEVNK